jgi:hypothetical protein
VKHKNGRKSDRQDTSELSTISYRSTSNRCTLRPSFYEVFEPEEAWRLSQRLEVHHTPVHGSWLNMAEIELSVLARQALSGRLPSRHSAQERVAVWQERRNRQQAIISWRFTTADARIKLKRLYPSIEA